MIVDDRRVASFRSGRRIATCGDLNEPIVLARSQRVPDTMSDDPVGWLQSLQPYARTWASVQFKEKKIFEGTDVDEAYIHTFIIRNDDDLSIEERDYIIHGNDMYNILTTREVARDRSFLMIRTKYSGRTDGERFYNGALRGPNITAPPPEAPPNLSGQAFWDQFGEYES